MQPLHTHPHLRVRVRRRVLAGLALAAWALSAGACAGAPASQANVRGTVRPGTARRPATGGPHARAPSCRGDDVDDAWAQSHFCVTDFAEGLDRPRHLAFAPNGDLFVATRPGVVILWDRDGDGMSSSHERALIPAWESGNHGIAFAPDGRYVYLAGDRTVRRFPYQPGMRGFAGAPEVVVSDLPATISHPYKTIVFDREGRLYVSAGSRDNLTPGAGATIMRYALPDPLPAGGVRYASGERFATGIRNAVALAWDHDGRLWALSNGRDDLHPEGTPETFFHDHPGDWIYRLSERPGTFYGYPFCWALGPVPWGDRTDPASQWPDPDAAEGHDAAWCQNPANVFPAAGALPAHTAPLGAVEYTGTLFPPEYRHNLFVASHGSWNRPGHQIGRTVLRLVVADGRVTRVEPVVGGRAGDGNLREGNWSRRPTGIAQGPEGALYVSSDLYGHILRVGYAP
jgi:glucose/arabinose dehydrogenase